MKHLKAYLLMCAKFSDNDCKGCPFASSATKYSDCHSYIIHHEAEAKEKIEAFVMMAKAQAVEEADSKCGFYSDGKYVTRCRNCGKAITIPAEDLIRDSYIHAFLFTCPKCGAEDEVPASAKKVGAKC